MLSSLRPSLVRFVVGPAALVSLAAEAHAGEPLGRPDTSFDGADWTFAFLAGDAAGAAGALVGGAIGAAAAGSCTDDGDSDQLFGDCFLHGVGETILGAGLGSIVGGAGGIYAYGQLSGHRGSYWAAAGGWTVGLLGGAGVMALAGDADQEAIGWAALLTLPALGGTLGYVLSLEGDEGGEVPVAALISVDGGRVAMGVPDIGLHVGRDGGVERVDLRLFGGRL